MKDKIIRSITISANVEMENHTANCGDKEFGNESALKQTNDGRNYISGQMIGHADYEAIKHLNEVYPAKDEFKGKVYISNSDGRTGDIKFDLASDLGGFMHTMSTKGKSEEVKDSSESETEESSEEGDEETKSESDSNNMTEKRIAPAKKSIAVSRNKATNERDLLINFKNINNKSEKPQPFIHKPFSTKDNFDFKSYLVIGQVGIKEESFYTAKGKNAIYLKTEKTKYVSEEERKRRVMIWVRAKSMLSDFANQTNSLTCAAPGKICIVFDTCRVNKAGYRWFDATEIQQNNYRREVEGRGGKIIIGDDSTEYSVNDAVEEACNLLECNMLDGDEINYLSSEATEN